MKNKMFSHLLRLLGQGNIITIHKETVDFCEGSLESAILLEQLLYWTPRSNSGWIAKSHKEWKQEIHLSRHSIDKAANYLISKGIVTTKIKKFNGAPTKHYKLDQDKFIKNWLDFFVDDEETHSDLLISTNGFADFDKSLTENTTKITKNLNKYDFITENEKKFLDVYGKLTKRQIQGGWGDILSAVLKSEHFDKMLLWVTGLKDNEGKSLNRTKAINAMYKAMDGWGEKKFDNNESTNTGDLV